MLSKLLITGLFVFALGAGVVSVNNGTAYADGNGSPVECSGNKNENPKADNVLSSKTGSDDSVVVDAGAGNVVDGVCIKSGSAMFGGASHSGVLGNGTYENGCYKVEGVGTQVATVTRLKDTNECQGISHVDVLFSKKQTVEIKEGGSGGGTTTPTTPTTPAAPAVTPQVSAPAAAVDAGGGAVMALIAALIGSVASLGYGVARLSKSGL